MRSAVAVATALFLTLLGLVAGASPASAASAPMKLTFTVSAGGSVRLPLGGTLSGITVDWGDSSSEPATGPITHVYAAAGTYHVEIAGKSLPAFGAPYWTGAGYLVSVESFGTLGTTDLSNAFSGAFSLSAVPATLPPGVTNLSQMFWQASVFNQPIAAWDTSSVTDMSGMFVSARAFNQPIAAWDTSSVTDMSDMFVSASAFNQPIAAWDTSSVTDMTGMFGNAPAFNQPIAAWDTSSVTKMTSMFASALAFNQPIAAWDTSSVTDMSGMFYGASAFNQPLETWVTSDVTNMRSMFRGADAFNQPLGGWNTGSVTDMSYMFSDAPAFNQPLGGWNTGSVTSMYSMFEYASAFNRPLGTWNTANVTDMRYMFYRAAAFNQALSTWNTGSVTYMQSMFEYASAFNQPLGGWNIGQVDYMDLMLNHTALSVNNYQDALVGWAAQGVRGVTLGAYGLYYDPASPARITLDSSLGWTITGDSPGVAPSFDGGFTQIFGTSAVGQTLTCGCIAGMQNVGLPVATLTYQWQSSETGAGGWADIPAATQSQYLVPDAQGSRYLRVYVGLGNGVGPGSTAFTPAVRVAVVAPSAPRGPRAVAGDAWARVSWSAPSSTGGAPIDRYTVTASPKVGTATRTCTTSRVGATPAALGCTVTGLTNGVGYTFTVTARNAVGSSPASVATSRVSPVGSIAVTWSRVGRVVTARFAPVPRATGYVMRSSGATTGVGSCSLSGSGTARAVACTIRLNPGRNTLVVQAAAGAAVLARASRTQTIT